VARDLAIDLGTASVLVYRLGDGIVFDDATVVALNAVSNEVVAVGEEAWRLIGSGSGDVIGVRPLRDGTATG
jgi:rod shape-determining protein MreB and related proteins